MTGPSRTGGIRRLAHSTGLDRLAPLVLSNGSGTILGHVTHMLVIPVQLASLGAAHFGLLALFVSIVTASAIADTGIGQTVMRFVARSARFPRLVEHVLASGLTVILMLGAALLGLSALAGWIACAGFGVTTIAEVSLPLVLTLASAALALNMLVSLALNTLRGLRDYTRFAACDITARVASPLVLAATAWLTRDILLVFAAQALLLAAMGGIFLTLAARSAGARLRPTTNLRYFRRRMFDFSKWVWLQALAGYLGGQSDRFVVAAFVSLSAAGYYAIAATLAGGVVGIATAASGFLLPEAASRLSQRDWLWRTFARATLALAGGAALAIFAFTLIAYPAVGLWLTPGEAGVVVPLLIPLLWAAASTVSSIPATQFMNAMGFQRLAALIGIAANLATAFGILLAGWMFGTFGVVGARLLVLPIGVAARTVTIHHVFARPNALAAALALTWPTLLGTVAGLLILRWLMA